MNSSTADRIAALVRQILAKRGLDRAVDHDADLNEAGLSSLDTVNLMLAVEAEFAVKIPDRDMTPANFRSVARHPCAGRSLTEIPRRRTGLVIGRAPRPRKKNRDWAEFPNPGLATQDQLTVDCFTGGLDSRSDFS